MPPLGELIHFAAAYGLTAEGRQALQSRYPLVPGRATATARSILSASVEEVPDVHTDPGMPTAAAPWS
jgi:hypothetical protein